MQKRAEKPEWVRVAEEFEASGLTQREFAGRRGLWLSTVQSWVYRHRRQVSTKVEPAVRLLPVQVSREPALLMVTRKRGNLVMGGPGFLRSRSRSRSRRSGQDCVRA
ncbi:IS66 family insertion sequence element accessory protein TnpA [Corallococcus terminator]